MPRRRPELDPRLTPHLACAYQLAATPPRWLWPHRIPAAAFTLLIGDPGIGKSLLAATIAAHCLTGRPWPDADLPLSPCGQRAGVRGAASASRNHLGGVIIANAEDHPGTIHRRLTLAGVRPDANNVAILRGIGPRGADQLTPLALPLHAPLLAEAIRAIDCPQLVILDPLAAFIAAPGDAGASGLNAVFAVLNDIARTYGVAILGIGHLAKLRTHRLLYRARGSLGFVAAARSVLLVAADPTDPPTLPSEERARVSADTNLPLSPSGETAAVQRNAELPVSPSGERTGVRGQRRLLLSLKSIDGPPPPPIAFHINAGPTLEWVPLATCPPVSSPDLADLSPEHSDALSEAARWLADRLQPGPQPAAAVLAGARAVGICERTLRRAKRLLRVHSERLADVWAWSLPRPAPGSAEHCQSAVTQTWQPWQPSRPDAQPPHDEREKRCTNRERQPQSTV
jgi:hypothetical protein